MPPKPAAGAKAAAAKGAAAKGGAAAPAVDPAAEVERRLLIEACVALQRQTELEAAQFAQFHEEKEKLNFLWIVAKKDLEDRKADLRNREREREDMAEAHAVEIKIYKQRIKHLLFEHQSEVTESKTDGQMALRAAQDEHRDAERELRGDRRDLKAVLREMEVAHEDFLKALKMEQDRGITELRFSFEREARELAAVAEDRQSRLREAAARAREEDVRAIERRKAKHIAALIAAHERAFADVRLYYNEITHSNLDLIKSLKEEVADLRRKEAGDEKVMYSIAAENKRMSEPMRRALDEVRRLRDAREAHRRDVDALAATKAEALLVSEKLETLRWEHAIVEQRCGNVADERDRLYARLQAALHDVKQKTGFRALLLERRLAAAGEDAERAALLLSEVLAAARLDPAVLGAVQRRLGDAVAAKDALIARLRGDVARVAAAHDAALAEYGSRMRQFGVPPEELGFTPLRADDILAASGGGAARRAGGAAGAGSGDGAG